MNLQQNLTVSFEKRRTNRKARRAAGQALRHSIEFLERRLLLSSVSSPTIASLNAEGIGQGNSSDPALTPSQVKQAYGIDQIMYGGVVGNGAGQTIAIIDPGDDSALVDTGSPSYSSSDLYQFDHRPEINLPDPPSFTVVGETGGARPSYIGIAGTTESGTTVTVTTTSPDGLSTGNNFSIAEAGVAAYDGGYTVTSITNPTTFTCNSTATPPPSGLAASTGGTINNPVSTLETTLDVEWSHAMAPAANIILIEMTQFQGPNIADAVNTAAALGATVVSMSFGAGEYSGETYGSPTTSLGISSATESGTTATITTSSTVSGYISQGCQITISGEGGYNGTFLVTSVPTSTSFTYTTVGGLSSAGSGGNVTVGFEDDTLFSNPGITYIASTGDNGQPAGYPSFSPNVLAVGATNLYLNADNSYSSETGWSNPAKIGGNAGGSAGGISQYESQPAYQQGTVTQVSQSTSFRTTPDISFVGGSLTPVETYDSFGNGGPIFNTWGTSVSAPCWAGLIAIADQGLTLQGKPTLNSSAAGFAGQTTVQTLLYDSPLAFFHDITSGYNGFNAGPGYDLVTGIGTPVANLLVPELAGLEPVAVTSPGNQSSVEGAAQTFSLGSYIDYGSGPVKYDINWGDGTPDSIVNGAPLTASGLSALHTYGDEGTYQLKFTVTDLTTNQAASYTINISVSDPAVIPTGGFAVNGVEGADSGIQTVATFTDPGGAEPNSFVGGSINDHYQASINWGDGSSPSSGTITYAGAPDSTTGIFTVQGDHTYGEEGTYTITVTIDHDTAPPAVALSTADVSDPSVIATGTVISAISCLPLTGVPIATFTDPGGAEPNSFDPTGTINNHYAIASINWGDGTPLDTTTGTLSYGGSPDSKTDPFTVSGSHTYMSVGTYTVTVVIDHEESTPTIVTSTITVKNNIGLLTLDPSHPASLAVTGNGSVDVNNCGAVVVDSNNPFAAIITGNGDVSAMDNDVTGGAITTGHGSFSTAVAHEAPTADPIGLPLPAAPATTFPAVYYSGKTTLTLSPGTYIGGIHDAGQGNIVLLPGIYYLKGGGLQVTGNGSLSGAGVLIINAPGNTIGNICFSGQGNITLSAPAPGSLPSTYALYKGITIFQDPASWLPISLTGNGSVTMDGALYAPGAPLVISGNGGLTDSTDTNAPIAEVIVYDADICGNGSLVINADAPASNPPLSTPLPGAAQASFTSFTTTANPAVPNQPITLSVTMASTPSVAGPPPGSVDFFDNTTHLDLGSVTLSGGVATLTTSLQSLGGHNITATYFSASPNYAPPSAPDSLAEQINSEAIESGTLYVGGDPSTHNIQVSLNKGQVDVNLDDVWSTYQTPLAGLNGVVVYGGDSGGNIQVGNNLMLPAYLFAGNGYTQIQGGGGPTLEIGGSGGSVLHGGLGRSILIAGTGQAFLQASSGGSILMGGYTDYDSNLPALQAALAEWSSSDSYATRTTSPALSIFSAATVHSNGFDNVLQGTGGPTPLDWFFASTLDQIFNQNASELKVTIT